MNVRACDRCHRRKSRCDKALPVCGQCKKAGIACRYVDRNKESREVIERLQHRLNKAEVTNRALSARLAAQSSQSGPEGQAAETPETEDSSERRTGHGADGNEVIEEVSFLSFQAGGERHFLGSASGVLFADLVNGAVQATANCQGNGACSQRENTAHLSSAGPTSSSSSTHPVEALPLPPERVARELHRAYFEHDHLSYPFLHRASALSTLNQAYADPSSLQRDLFGSVVFDMILAIATASVHKVDLERLPDAEGYRMRATPRLHQVLQAGGAQSLQVILLLCQYRMTSSIQDSSTSLWHIVGIAARMCFEMGLHREEIYRKSHPGGSSDVIDNEIRRRCFWCVVAMDRILSITLGRPLAIRVEDVDTVLPDSAFDNVVNRHVSDDQETLDFCRTDLFNHIIRYRIICGDILSLLHSKTGRMQNDKLSALAARDKIAGDLVEWHNNTALLSLPDVDLTSALPGDLSSYRAQEWYEMLYYNARLILYRPSPVLSSVSSKDPIVLQAIFEAAKQSIRLYAHLHRSRRINYTWITLHSVFMTGLSYVYAVGQHFRSCKNQSVGSVNEPLLTISPTILEIVNDSRACSNVLVAISDRWNSSKHCHDVFDRLSNAVLSDAIEYHTKKDNQGISQTREYSFNQPEQPDFMIPESTAVGGDWNIDPSFLAVDSVLHECFDELQQFPIYSADDPIRQFSHDWLGEIGGMPLNLPSTWGT